MKFVPQFSGDDIRKALEKKAKAMDTAVLMRLQRVGETFVKNARENGNYTDRTGNLRNSIGYVILRDGEQLFDNFKRSAKIEKKVIGKDGKEQVIISKGSHEGVNVGKAIADEVAKDYPNGYVLIVVAGMNYATAVESYNKDVLTASGITAKNDLKAAMEKVKKAINEAA